ncbi:hypothetical protein JCM8097_008018 [Rhodosporidiobolus ruineniae]
MLSTLQPTVQLSVRPISRFFSSSSSSLSASSIPSRVYSGLYYHPAPSPAPTTPPTRFSVSFLPSPPPNLAFSPTTLGFVRPLPPSATLSSFDQKDQPPRPQEDPRVPPITPRNWDDNPQFLPLLHQFLQANVENDLWLQTQAKAVEGNDTYIHIADQRAPADANRQPHPQDVLASVLVQEGKLVPSSYEANTTAYRLVSNDGLLQLPEQLRNGFIEACERVREIEKEAAEAEEGKGE